MRILVVDDDPVSRAALRGLLVQAGHQPLLASDGQEALDLHRQQRCDVLITDWQMPVVSGLELTQQIRALDGEVTYTWIILLTGSAGDDAQDASSAAQVDDHLTKPVRRGDLLRRLEVGKRIVLLQRALHAERSELRLANARMARDLHAAEQAQRALLPQQPVVPAPWRIAWRYRPCQELAGDLLGVERLDEHRLGLHVFDVSGHGVSSALMAVQVHGHLSIQAGAGSVLLENTASGPRVLAPVEVPPRLNDLFLRPGSSRFLTFAYVILDLRDGSLDMVSCAHPSPLILRADGRTDSFAVESHPLGILPTGKLMISTWKDRLHPGDRLVLTSDGLIEAASPALEDFTADRLVAAIRSEREPEPALDAALRAVTAWVGGPPTDDQTLLMIQYG